MSAGWGGLTQTGHTNGVVVEEDSDDELKGPGNGNEVSVEGRGVDTEGSKQSEAGDWSSVREHDNEGTKRRTLGLVATLKPASLPVPDRSILSIALSEWWRALDGPVTQVVQTLYTASQSRLALVVAFSVVLAILLVARYFYLEGDLVALFEDGITPIAFVVSLLSFGAVIMVLLETLKIKSAVDVGLCQAISRVRLTS